ncbi:MAG: T9SS type A sorting domain-containing protein [Taibaiella sp.]|nr:T9SS type A sorting domain-containing protein [Taibaiella sp.]
MLRPLIGLAVFVCCIITHTIHAQAIYFDHTFGTGGKTFLPMVAGDKGHFRSMAIQPDGKIVVVGNRAGASLVVRFKENGTPDSSFGTNGIYRGVDYSVFYDVTLQPNGKIIAVGNGAAPGFTFAQDGFYVVRLNINGTPDNTFGSSGSMAVLVAGNHDDAHAVALQADGKIVVTGKSNSWRACVIRLHSNGSMDSSFGNNGIVTNANGDMSGLCITTDGKIVVAGYASPFVHDYSMIILRYLTDGTPDSTFNHTGIVYTLIGEGAGYDGSGKARLQPDGRLLVSGTGGFGPMPSDLLVVRYNTNGSIDETFGNAGIAQVDINGDSDIGYDICLAPDGRILICGTSLDHAKALIAVACLNTDGTPDYTFGDEGSIRNYVRDNIDNGYAIALQADWKVVVAGSSSIGTYPSIYQDPALLRYSPYRTIVNETPNTDITLQIYPNPTSGTLYIHSANGIINATITDMTGRLVNAPFYQQYMNMSLLQDGIYLLHVTLQDGRSIVRPTTVIH